MTLFDIIYRFFWSESLRMSHYFFSNKTHISIFLPNLIQIIAYYVLIRLISVLRVCLLSNTDNIILSLCLVDKKYSLLHFIRVL